MPEKKKYPNLAERERLAAEAEEQKIEKAEKAEAAKDRAEERRQEKAKKDGVGLGAALQRVADKHETITAAREDHSGAVAEYLKPYLKKLNALEMSIKEFPMNTSIPWADIESDVLDPTSPENIREVGERYGVERKALYDMSKKRKWTRRRAIVMELHSRSSTVKSMASISHAMVGGNGDPQASVVNEEELLVGLVNECLNQINVALASGLIPFRSAGDVDKIVRLLLHVQGKVDDTQQERETMTPAMMETIAAKVAKNLKVDAAMAGLVVIGPVQEAEFEVVEDEPLAGDWADDDAEVDATVEESAAS